MKRQIFKNYIGAGELDQQLVFAVLVEDPGRIPVSISSSSQPLLTPAPSDEEPSSGFSGYYMRIRHINKIRKL